MYILINEQTTIVMIGGKMVNLLTSIVNLVPKKRKSVDLIGLDKQNFSA